MHCMTFARSVIVRSMTSGQVATALRPFYFAVHPDLFAQHPKERAVNEESLKHLSFHISQLQTQTHHVSIVDSVLFYIKDITSDKRKPFLRSVKISLRSSSVHEAVQNVLHSCQLPLDYIKSISPQSSSKSPPRRPASYYQRYDRAGQSYSIRRDSKTLLSWLNKNIKTSRERQSSLVAVQGDIERLIADVKDATGVCEIRWDSRWSLRQYRACLKSFLRLYKEHAYSVDISGYSLVFGNDTGFSCQGAILLKASNVPENWLHLLQTVKKQDGFLKNIPAAENRLSALLNGIMLTRRQDATTILASDYLEQLLKLSGAVEQYKKSDREWLTRTMDDVNMVLECAAGPLTISDEGFVLVPSSCPVFLLVSFLNTQAEEARWRRAEYIRKRSWERESESECLEKLSLLSFSRDVSVTAEQMEHCCQNLLAHCHDLMAVNLAGCNLRVSQFYSVMSDGEIYIPWNWKTLES